jgi:hypothetical protein
MRKTILSSVASIALFGIGFTSIAQADARTDRDSTITVTAGQGGNFTIPFPAATHEEVAVSRGTRQDRPIEVTAGNGGALPTFVHSTEPAALPGQAVASIDGN